ncbi:hypothetical protein H6F89_19845 [Cyanobacteria bacterium FACHB-63]|nr:hypothetical protein [Cyanobacteria bacterium FACHB-63]
MSMIRKGQVKEISRGDSVSGARFINELFGGHYQLNRNMKQRLLPLNDRFDDGVVVQHRNDHRPVKEHFLNRAFTSSLSSKLLYQYPG